jgi:hypothetical protein
MAALECYLAQETGSEKREAGSRKPEVRSEE